MVKKDNLKSLFNHSTLSHGLIGNTSATSKATKPQDPEGQDHVLSTTEVLHPGYWEPPGMTRNSVLAFRPASNARDNIEITDPSRPSAYPGRSPMVNHGRPYSGRKSPVSSRNSREQKSEDKSPLHLVCAADAQDQYPTRVRSMIVSDSGEMSRTEALPDSSSDAKRQRVPEKKHMVELQCEHRPFQIDIDRFLNQVEHDIESHDDLDNRTLIRKLAVLTAEATSLVKLTEDD